VLCLVVPVEGEGVGVAVDGVRYCDHLVEIRGEAGELGQIGLGHGAGRLAMMQIGAAGVVVQGCCPGDRGDIA
jgi:hypothetical protein